MSDERQDGGPAFPLAEGMSLRDWFAGQAIGLFSLNDDEVSRIRSGVSPLHGVVAKFCYGLADAMLKEREEVPE